MIITNSERRRRLTITIRVLQRYMLETPTELQTQEYTAGDIIGLIGSTYYMTGNAPKYPGFSGAGAPMISSSERRRQTKMATGVLQRMWAISPTHKTTVAGMVALLEGYKADAYDIDTITGEHLPPSGGRRRQASAFRPPAPKPVPATTPAAGRPAKSTPPKKGWFGGR